MRLLLLRRITAVSFAAATFIGVVTWMTYGALINAYALTSPRAPDAGRAMVVMFQAKSANVYIDPFEAFFIVGLKWAWIVAGGVAVVSFALRRSIPKRSDLPWLTVSDAQVCFTSLACVIALSVVGTF